MGLLRAGLRFRDLGRLRTIVVILGRHGFDDVAQRLGFVGAARTLWNRIRRRERRQDDRRTMPIEQRVRKAMEDLGPTFVKLGQVLAARPDLVPMNLVQELRHLHDEVSPLPYAQIRPVLERDWGRPVTEVVRDINEEALASASIAQVHGAELLDGRRVVVKVKRPGIERVMQADLRLLSWLAEILERRVPELRQFKPLAVVGEFRKALALETDFTIEMHNMLRYRRNFQDEPDLMVPEPVPELCTRNVLVMERVNGVKVTDKRGLAGLQVDLERVVDTGIRVTLRSIFEFGFFHADPHPGNFFVQQDGKIALLDFGMMGCLDQKRIDELLTFMLAMVTGDVDMMVSLLVDADLVSEETDLRGLQADLNAVLTRYSETALGQVDLASFLGQVMDIVRRHGVQLPADLLLAGKAVATMEGIGREVYPQFEPIKAIRPYLSELYVRRMLDTSRHTQTLAKAAIDMAGFLRDVPQDLRRVVRKLRKGELALVTRPDQRAMVRAENHRSNKYVLALLTPTFYFGGLYMLGQDSLLYNVGGFCALGLSLSFLVALVGSMTKGGEP